MHELIRYLDTGKVYKDIHLIKSGACNDQLVNLSVAMGLWQATENEKLVV